MINGDLSAAAHHYLDLGLKVIPLRPGTKIPITQHGSSDATDDHQQVDQWWQRWPDANVAICTGHMVDVIDLDGWQGQEAFAQLKDEPTILGSVNTVRDGGLHLYVTSTGHANGAGVLPAVDYRGRGGYVVAPPSKITIDDDHEPRQYTWAEDLDLARSQGPEPAWLASLETKPTERKINGVPHSASDHDDDRLTRYLESAVQKEIQAIEDAPEGTRNHALNTAAFNLGQLAQYLDHLSVLADIATAARSRGLGDAEILRTFSSGWEAGKRQPRTPELHDQGWSVTFEDDDHERDDDLAEFWQRRPEFDHVRQIAFHHAVSPWALLGTIMMRVITSVPPWVTLPAIVGGKGSLNSFLCIVGTSGIGKSAAVDVAAEPEALIIKQHDQRYEPRSLPMGTGEGMLHQYATIEKIDGKPTQMDNSDMRILWTNMEVNLIKALTSRSGSLLIELLKDAWNGATLGMTYYNKGQGSPILARHSYRLCVILGAQPENVEALLDDQVGGFPQRLLWLPAIDPDIPVIKPDDPGPLIIDQTWPNTAITITVPQEIQTIIMTERVARVRGDDLGDLEGHQRYLQLKIAAALMIINGRRMMTMDDWVLADMVITRSKATRDDARRKIKIKHDQERKAAHDDAARQAAVVRARVRDVDDKHDHDEVRRVIMIMLAEPCRRRDVQRKIGNRRQAIFLAVLEDLTSRGVVVEGKRDGERGVWLWLA